MPAKLTKNGETADGTWLVEARLEGEQIQRPSLPLEVLGTKVSEQHTKFTGTAISLALHHTGCVHFNLQPPAISPSVGD
jgi:hypothetical protein